MGYDDGESLNNDKVTKEMMDAFNNRSGKPERWIIGSIKSQYLRGINKGEDYRDKFYDVGLVEEVSGSPTVSDLNINKVLLLRSLKYWGFFVICVLIFFGLTQLATFDNGIVKFIVLILSFISCAFMFSVLLKNIKGFIKTIGSSRDMKFKLLSVIQILPIIIIFSCLTVFYGVEVPVLLFVLFLIFGGFGYGILVWLGWDDILDLI